jgi:hypothetical protein
MIMFLTLLAIAALAPIYGVDSRDLRSGRKLPGGQ